MVWGFLITVIWAFGLVAIIIMSFLMEESRQRVSSPEATDESTTDTPVHKEAA